MLIVERDMTSDCIYFLDFTLWHRSVEAFAVSSQLCLSYLFIEQET